MSNQQKRYKTRSRKKPIFSDKKSGNSAVGIIIMIVLLAAMVFIGYSVGKPIVDYFSGRPANTVPDDPPLPSDDDNTHQPVSTAPEPDEEEPISTTEQTASVEPAPQPHTTDDANILYVKYPGKNGGAYDTLVSERIKYAAENNFSGICIELVADGGEVLYNTQSELALLSEAIAPNGITSLNEAADYAKASGLTVYARVSALSDHLASWYDKGVAYMIEGSISRWLDNAIDKGGKPWLSPFEQKSKDYIAGFVAEISSAGFDGIILGEVEFPDFRKGDLDYIGDRVKSTTRYKALGEFSSYAFASAGEGRQTFIEIDAADIISGKAEILTAPDTIGTKNIYVRFSPTELGTRVTKADGSVISFEGLSSAYTLKAVMQTVNEELSGSGLTAIPIISGCEIDDSMRMVLDELNLGDNVIIEE